MNAFASAACVAILAVVALNLQGCFGGAPPAKVCAENEKDVCTCKGNVTYGIKFADGKPGKGNITTFEQVNAKPVKSKIVNGTVVCSAGAMGGDPAPGFYKSCWCQPESVSATDKLRAAAASAKAHAHAAADKAKEMAGAAKEKAKAAAAKAKAFAKKAKAGMGNLTDAAKAKLAEAKAKAGNLTDVVKAKAGEAADAAKAKIAEAQGKAKDAETADKDAADVEAAAAKFDAENVGMGSANFFPVFIVGCGTGVLMMYIVSTIQRRNHRNQRDVHSDERSFSLASSHPLE